jgi:hypothetical protein
MSNTCPLLIIFTKGKTPLISDGIRAFTRSEYTHSSISTDIKLDEIYSYNMKDGKFGFIKEDKSFFQNNIFTIYMTLISTKAKNKLHKIINDFNDNKTHYDIKILIHKLINLDTKPIGTTIYDQVCSTFVDTVLKGINIDISLGKKIPSPADLYNGVIEKSNSFFQVFSGKINEYNPTDISKKITSIMKSFKLKEVSESVEINTLLESLYITLEDTLTSKERNELSDEIYGLPYKRKYPLTDEEHVRKAIQFFNYSDISDEKELAKNINKRAKELNMKIEIGEKNRFGLYADTDIIK